MIPRSQIRYPPELPICARRAEIIEAIRHHPVVIIAGETGSGKTTQLPKMCLDAGYGLKGRVGCTQPRRVAALSISRRIAAELGVSWGHEVGCKIRFQDRSHRETVIKLMTDGILLAEIQTDPELKSYEVLIIDEAHERSLNIDFLLGYLKTLLPRRPDLKVLITSATIDTAAFSEAFHDAPVLEVSGRLYPVEIRYAPHDPDAEERGDLTYIDAAMAAVERAVAESARGDVLVFMPSERDIREMVEDLKGVYGDICEILPLFGRLASGEQERVFQPSARRKVIVATNIAETSLTIPGIRYVVDPGLARVSRYSPRTRTKRLPIEPISQSSANQRAGRTGRVEDGVCIRLYSEEAFLALARFTQPEIQRANLAEVILRMMAFRLGEMERFPFLNPPAAQAVQAGYKLLQELGALDEQRQLTPLGRDLARLPVDPSIGRMILQSIQENACAPVLIIAAGLSIQDPRERPLDRQREADAAHRRFVHPESDFLTLLNIWEAYHETWDTLRTQNQLRKFCKTHFLSYLRMREWRDIHGQLMEFLPDIVRRQNPKPAQGRAVPAQTTRTAQGLAPSRPADLYGAIHRSILTGLLGHVAHREGRNLYRAAGNREVMVFPGSGLFDRSDPPGKPRPRLDAPNLDESAAKVSQPEWVMAGELLETSRLFIRTAARIQPGWITELGPHVVRRHYIEPRWDDQARRAMVLERCALFGLRVSERWIDYGTIDPVEATRMLIRHALIETDSPLPHQFAQHNQDLRQRIEMWRSRTRDPRFPDPAEALFQFYESRLCRVSSVHDLNRLVRDHIEADPDYLCATDHDLTGGRTVPWDEEAFPPWVELAGQRVPVEYAYAPGEDHDGITLKLPAALAHRVQQEMLDWIIPGLREDQVAVLLKALPKKFRVALMPYAPKVKELAAALLPNAGLESLRDLIFRLYGIEIPPGAWTRECIPAHLRVRVAILGANRQVVVSGRDVGQLKPGLEAHETPAEQSAWDQSAARWERFDVRAWTFGDPPEHIEVTTIAGAPLMAFPGLVQDDAAVHLRLFRQRDAAERATRQGWIGLAERALTRELGWLKRDLNALSSVQTLYATLGPAGELIDSAYAHLRHHLFQPPVPLLPLRQTIFEQTLVQARATLPELASRLRDLVKTILELRQRLVMARQSYPGLDGDLQRLVGSRFLEHIPHSMLPHVPRYLKAMLIRAERASLSPAKDQNKALRLQPYREALARWNEIALRDESSRPIHESLRWLVEEYAVSIFAQELGTPQPVSSKRLDALLDALRKEHPNPS